MSQKNPILRFSSKCWIKNCRMCCRGAQQVHIVTTNNNNVITFISHHRHEYSVFKKCNCKHCIVCYMLYNYIGVLYLCMIMFSLNLAMQLLAATRLLNSCVLRRNKAVQTSALHWEPRSCSPLLAAVEQPKMPELDLVGEVHDDEVEMVENQEVAL